MTTIVNVTASKNAKAKRSDGTEYELVKDTAHQISLTDGQTLEVSEVEAEDEGGVATTQGGGNGTPPPTHD